MEQNGGFNATAFLAGLHLAVTEDDDDSFLMLAERIGSWLPTARPEQLHEMIDAFDECLRGVLRAVDDRSSYICIALVTLRTVLYGRYAQVTEGSKR